MGEPPLAQVVGEVDSLSKSVDHSPDRGCDQRNMSELKCRQHQIGTDAVSKSLQKKQFHNQKRGLVKLGGLCPFEGSTVLEPHMAPKPTKTERHSKLRST